MEKREIRLYNMILPLWLLWIFPQVWLLILPGNLLIDTAVLLFGQDEAFRQKFGAQPYFCLPHYERLLSYARQKMNKKAFKVLEADARRIEEAYYTELHGDVSWFCKKFDYRYEDEPWNNAKDAVERAGKFLRGDLHVPKK